MSKILIIDDEDMLRKAIGDYFEDLDYQVLHASQGEEGLDLFHSEKPDAVLLDLDMPKINGFEVLKQIQKRSPETPVVVISGVGIVGDAVNSLRLGAWDFISKPIKDLEILLYTMNRVFERARLIKENQEYKERLEEKVKLRTTQLQEANQSLQKTQVIIVQILARAGDYRDNETGKHVIRISKYSEIIAKARNLPPAKVELIARTAPLHDIGKIGIRDEILLKPGPLNEEERKEMMQHCQIGFEILTVRTNRDDSLNDLFEHVHDLADSQRETEQLLSYASNIALFHHERWDGKGYPLGLKGDTIPIESRIAALADIYDALGSPRPYKETYSEEKCQTVLKELSGTALDPELVSAFFESVEEIVAVKERWQDEISS